MIDLEERKRINKELCKEMPYLIIRDWKSGEIPEDYDYSYTWLDNNELPDGWQEHFKNMCYEIKKPLEDAGIINDFSFVQVKEKYNTMRCYHSGATKEVDDIIEKYELDAIDICTICGKKATCYTTGYIASYCDECAKNLSCKTRPLGQSEN